MITKSLYQIKQEYQQIIHILEENEGEMTEQLENALTITEAELKEKSLSIVHVLSKLKSDRDYGKEQIRQAQEYVKGKERAIEFLEQYLLDVVLLYGPIETGTHKISSRKSESVQVDEALLPDSYFTKKVVRQPNKALIKECINEGFEVPGAKIVENQNLQIK